MSKKEQKTIDGRWLRGERTRRKIVSAAIETISKEGIKGFTASNVARRAGVNKSALFHHFKTMDDLFVHCFDVVMDSGGWQAFEGEWNSIREYLEAIGVRTIEFIEANSEFLRGSIAFIERMVFNPKLFKRGVVIFEMLYQLTLQGLQTSTKNQIPQCELEEIALAVAVQLDSLLWYHYLLEDPQRLRAMWNATVDAFTCRIEQLLEINQK